MIEVERDHSRPEKDASVHTTQGKAQMHCHTSGGGGECQWEKFRQKNIEKYSGGGDALKTAGKIFSDKKKLMNPLNPH